MCCDADTVQLHLVKQIVYRDRLCYSLTCPLFKVVNYENHKYRICTLDLNRLYRQGLGYWKLNASLPARKDFRNQNSELVKQMLAGQ